MDDSKIIELYWQRDESAVKETDLKYGGFCRKIAYNILCDFEDTQECVNDTYLKAWNAIPPQRPDRFQAWIGRITRNLSLNLWNRSHAAKRAGGAQQLLSELEDCIPDRENIEIHIEAQELGKIISDWLRTLSAEDRILFINRYWNGTPILQLAEERNIPANRLAQKMYRLRMNLRNVLEKEGVFL